MKKQNDFIDCKNCIYDGNQMIFKSACTGCCSIDEFKHFIAKENLIMLKCCGNCHYMDILIDKGGVCTFEEEISCDRNGYCNDWKLNKKD
jgi:hypothetical protein